MAQDEVLILPGLALIDIISAIQIMDPRMDTGCGKGTDVDLRFDASQELRPAEVMMIMDISLACEITWYSGRLLSQTVLMSNYLRHLDELNKHTHPLIKHVLRAYLLGLTKCCAIVLDEISKGHLRENEDIHYENQTIDFNEDIDISQTLHDLDQAHAILNAWPDELEGYRMPFMERLRFRIEYLYSLALLTCSPETSSISQLEIHLLSASEALQWMRFYSNSDSSISFSDQSPGVRAAFDLNFFQSVPSNSPPRPVDFPKSLHDLLSVTQRILGDLLSITQIALGSSVPDWVSFFHGFSRQDPLAFPLVRSYLLSLFQEGNVIALDKEHTLDWLVRQGISNFSAGNLRLESNGAEIRYIFNRFAGLIVNYLSAFAASRARGRRMLSNSLVEWKALYSATLSNRLVIPPSTLQTIQTLIYYFSIESGLQIVLMGFDLELYDNYHDRLSMWWAVERLSERSCRLLQILSGGVESLDTRILRYIGTLAGAASQLARQKGQVGRETLINRRAIFQRRLKSLTAYQASFEDTHLIDELDLPRNLLDYQAMNESKCINPDLLHRSLEDAHRQLKQIHIQAQFRKKIGLERFKIFVHTLIQATEKMILMSSEHQGSVVRSFGNLKVSDRSEAEDVPDGSRDDGAESQAAPQYYDESNGDLSRADMSRKWFLM